ncbi:MAG: hypothetical protein L0154_19245 [Chloroflexi bacterium]|nr:hypothetical protein [Chloroflexota bacterium]
MPETAEGLRALAQNLLGQPQGLWLILILLGMVGYDPPRHRLSPTPQTTVLALAGVVPLMITVLLTWLSEESVLSLRSLSIITPALALLAGWTVARLPRLIMLPLVGILMVNSLSTSSAWFPIRYEWPEATKYLAERSTPQDVVLIEAYGEAYPLQVHFRQTGMHYWASELDRFDHPRQFQDYLKDKLSYQKSVWVAKQDAIYYDIRRDLTALGFINTASMPFPT